MAPSISHSSVVPLLAALWLSLTGCAESDCSRTATCPGDSVDASALDSDGPSVPVVDAAAESDLAPSPADASTGPALAPTPDGGAPSGPVAIDVGTGDEPDASAPSSPSPTLDPDATRDGGTPPTASSVDAAIPADAGTTVFDGGADAGPVEAAAPALPPPEYVLHGEVFGLVGSVTLLIGGEPLTLTSDGPFSVPGWLAGESYSISVSAQPVGQACSVGWGEGVFGDSDVSGVTIYCYSDVAELAVLALDGEALGSDFVTETSFERSVSVFTQRVSLVATLADPGATLTVDGAPVVSGEALALDLPLGTRTVEIQVTAPSLRVQQYSVAISRRSEVGAPILVTAPAPNGADGFGSGVSTFGDILFVDRDTESSPGGPEAFLFQLDQGDWVFTENVEDAVGTAFRIEHAAVCQDTLAVAVTIADGSPNQTLRIARRSGTTFSYVTALGTFTGARDVACDDGSIAVRHAGGVQLFVASGSSWSLGPAFVLPADTHGSLVRDRLALQGDLLVVGDPDDDSGARGVDGDPVATCPSLNCASGSGAAYVFEKNSLGTWQQAAYLKAANAAAGASFGSSVSVHEGVVLIGAYSEDSSATTTLGPSVPYDCGEPAACQMSSGAAYLFEQVDGDWQEVAYIKRFRPDAGYNFGSPVTIFGDLLVIGTVYDNEFAPSGGAATLYHRSASGIIELDTFHSEQPGTDDYFPKTALLTERGLFCSAYNRQPGFVDHVAWFRD